MRFQRPLLPVVLALVALPSTFAQTTFFGVQPNETKGDATPAFDMVSGDMLRKDAGCPPLFDAEIFRVRTAPLAPGIYRHRIVPVMTVNGNFPRILGRSQFDATIDVDSTVVVQEGVDDTTPQRFVQWYGFGGAEEVYVDLDNTQLCRTSIISELETTPVNPIPVPGVLPAGAILTVSPTANSPTTDVDLWLYDADFDAIPEASRRLPFFGLPELRVPVTAGTYYVGVSQGPFHHHQPAEFTDDFDSDDVLDFRGAAVSSRRDIGTTVELSFQGVNLTGVFTEPWQILWFQVTVDSGQNAGAFCPGDGTAGTCACGPSAAGQGAGCANSTGRGARLYAHGALRFFDVIYEIEDLPPGAATLVFAGLSSSAGSPAFGGNSCLGTGLIRLDVTAADETGTARVFSGSEFFNAGFMAGTTVFAQAAYRDSAAPPCNANFTNGAVVTVRM